MPQSTKEPTTAEIISMVIVLAFFGFCGYMLIWGDVKLFKTDAAKREADQREVRQLTTCKNAIRERAKIPDESDFEWAYDYATDGVTAMIRGKVKLMNGFGVMIPHTYMCHFEGELLAEAIAVEG